jgi:hypothetical protein
MGGISLIGEITEYDDLKGVGSIGRVQDYDGIKFRFNFKRYLDGYPEVGYRVSFEGSRGQFGWVADYIRRKFDK